MDKLTDNDCETLKPKLKVQYSIFEGKIGTWNSSTIVTRDSNIIIVGATSRSEGSQSKIIKTLPSGKVLFSTLSQKLNTVALGVYENEKGEIYIVGYSFEDVLRINRKLNIAKLTSSGKFIWENIYHQDKEMFGHHISQLNSNEIIVTGNAGKSIIFLMKLDENGNEIGFSKSTGVGPNGMLILDNKRILLTDGKRGEISLTFYDSDLNQIKDKFYDQVSSIGRSSIQLENGDIVSVGNKIVVVDSTNSSIQEKVLVMKTSSEGDLKWLKTVGADNSFYNDGQSIRENQDGSFMITGYNSIVCDGVGDRAHMLIHIDDSGNLLNMVYYNDDETKRGYNINKIENDRNIITGDHENGIFMLNVNNLGKN